MVPQDDTSEDEDDPPPDPTFRAERARIAYGALGLIAMALVFDFLAPSWVPAAEFIPVLGAIVLGALGAGGFLNKFRGRQ